MILQPRTPSGQWDQALDLNCPRFESERGYIQRGSSARSERQPHELDVLGSNPSPSISQIGVPEGEKTAE